MGTSFLIWILVSIIGVVISLANKQKQKAAKAQTARRDSVVEAEEVWDGREFVTPITDANAHESGEQTDGAEQTLPYSFEDEEMLTPEMEGNYHRSYTEAEDEGELAVSSYSFAEQEGVSSISEETLRAMTMKDVRSQAAFTSSLLPNGQPFNLQTAMYYDVILHRRTHGFLQPRQFNTRQ